MNRFLSRIHSCLGGRLPRLLAAGGATRPPEGRSEGRRAWALEPRGSAEAVPPVPSCAPQSGGARALTQRPCREPGTERPARAQAAAEPSLFVPLPCL